MNPRKTMGPLPPDDFVQLRCAEDAVKKPAVKQAFDSLRKELDSLAARAELVRDRLAPVLSSGSAGPSKELPPASCEFENLLNAASACIADVNGTLSSILERLEI